MHQKELQKNLHVRPERDSQKCGRVTNVIIKYWDWFYKEGDQQPILEYEFSIDTGTSKPVYCGKPQYRPYESKIVMSQIESLLQNEWIEECGGPWGISIVLAENPHQEHVTNIDDLYGVCAYPIGSLTRPRNLLNFQYPVATMQSAVLVRALMQFLSSALTPIWVTIKFKCAKLIKNAAFFSPNEKNFFCVMPFGPTNVP